MPRAAYFTSVNKIPTYYSDIQNNLQLNPISQQIAIVTNEQSVSQSLKNLVLTNIGERFYHPEIGSKVQSLIFEPGGSITANLLKTTITETITNQEPRVSLQSITVTDDSDNDAYWIQIVFTMLNISQPITLNFPIYRVR